MTRLWNDPAAFADEMIDGFVAANGRYVRRVPGGVVRSTVVPDGQVAVVIGGGSGHYPAFGGLVGQGLAHGAAMGNLFASPSTQQVVSVAQAAEHGGGVFFSYGNYAGDVLNFDAAQDRLRAEGIACETVTVTDDISSAPADERHKRRGIAGDLTVFRIAAAAAEAGYDLAEVTASPAWRTSAPARSASPSPAARSPAPRSRCSPCPRAAWRSASASTANRASTRPTSRPPTGWPNCSSTRLLDELPDGIDRRAGARVVPILNGLGAVKYEELFVVYRRVAAAARRGGRRDRRPARRRVLHELRHGGHLAHPVLARRRARAALGRPGRHARLPPRLGRRGRARRRPPRPTDADRRAIPRGERRVARRRPRSPPAPSTATAATIDTHVDELGRLDQIAGDGDHGIGMQRGAARRARRRDRRRRARGRRRHRARPRRRRVVRPRRRHLRRAVGRHPALDRRDDRRRGRAEPRHPSPPASPRRAAGVTAYGKAEVGDKTMVDALVPFSTELTARRRLAAPRSPTRGRRAADAATRAAAATADLLPRMGRARPHAEKSLGTPDPGAHSLALIATAIGALLADDLATKGTDMPEPLRIVVGCDDAGFDYKEILKRDLEANPGVASVVDVGVDADGHTAYPRIAIGRRRARRQGRGRPRAARLRHGPRRRDRREQGARHPRRDRARQLLGRAQRALATTRRCSPWASASSASSSPAASPASG